MNRLAARTCALLAVAASVLGGCSKESPHKAETRPPASSLQAGASRQVRLQAGKALFKQFCANCHPDGDNVSDPKRNLHGSTLRAKHITRPEDIVKIMRNPLSRMLRFDATTIPEADALEIAEYVLYAFR